MDPSPSSSGPYLGRLSISLLEVSGYVVLPLPVTDPPPNFFPCLPLSTLLPPPPGTLPVCFAHPKARRSPPAERALLSLSILRGPDSPCIPPIPLPLDIW